MNETDKSLYGGTPSSTIDFYFRVTEAMVVLAFNKYGMNMDEVVDVAADAADRLDVPDEDLVIITDQEGPAEMGMSMFSRNSFISPSENTGKVDREAVVEWAVATVEKYMIRPMGM